MAVFTGNREDSFKLAVGLSGVAQVVKIYDKIGFKTVNVYIWTKREGSEDQWKQLLPTPSIKNLDHVSQLSEGGMILEGRIMLENIPARTKTGQANTYTEEELQTASSEEGVKRYWVLAGPGVKPKAYTTERIIKTSPIFFDLQIKRFDAINSKDITIPP